MFASFLVFLVLFVLSVTSTSFVLNWLRRGRVLDIPNERSSHQIPTPRGGGLGIWLVFFPAILFWNLLRVEVSVFGLILLGLGLILILLSWADDKHHLPAKFRLLVQALVVGLALMFLPWARVFPDFLPLWIEHIFLFFAWIWFINLFNFMDGIDGISGVEAISVAGGAVLFLMLAGQETDVFPPLALATCVAGFLVWNWYPAKVFLGDVGSIPLGFFLGAILLQLAGHGFWYAALLLPLYYWWDASFTLIKRVMKGENPLQPHRQHFYQRLLQTGKSHAEVSLLILAINVGLLGVALIPFFIFS